MKNLPNFEQFINESHYAFLGGERPLDDKEMRMQIVEPELGKNYDAYIMFKGPRGEYDKMKSKYTSGSEKWKTLYRSSSYQGDAKISPDKKVIYASILDGGGIVGAIYVKK